MQLSIVAFVQETKQEVARKSHLLLASSCKPDWVSNLFSRTYFLNTWNALMFDPFPLMSNLRA